MDIKLEIPSDVSEILSEDITGKQKILRMKMIGYSEYMAKFYIRAYNNQVIRPVPLNRNDQQPVFDKDSLNKTNIEKNFKIDKGNIDVTSTVISTVDQAIEAAEVDLKKWEIVDSTVGSWNTTMKIKNIHGQDEPITKTNYTIKIKLKAKLKNTVEETIKIFSSMLPKNPTVYPKLPPKPKANLMLECGLVDHHFGMLAWAKETLSDYDLKIAEILYVEAVKKAINRIPNPEQIGKILIPIGHDFFHINDQTNSTPRAGHQLDVDGRVPKVYATGKMAAINVIEYCRNIAPVEVVYVSGNHDPQMSYFLCDSIASWFRECPDVTVDLVNDIVSPLKRKYRQWGNGLLGMTHGLDEKMADLPLIMANEVPQLWADTIYREVHMGHYHKTRTSFKHHSDTFTPVIVRTLPSLCGADDYSYSHGWLARGVQAAEFYVWDKEFGQVGNIVVKAEEII